MSKCFILCNLNNPDSNYIVSSYAGSNMSYYLGDIISGFQDVVFVNVGAPRKKWNSKSKYRFFTRQNKKIVEFYSGPSFLPVRIKAKIMIHRAVKYILNEREPSDFVLVYHSSSFCSYYKKIVTEFGKSHSLLHVAEIYSDVGNIKIKNTKEIEYINQFRKHIFMSKGIAEQTGNSGTSCNYTIAYGVYKKVENLHPIKSNVVNIVYAGTASKIKGGLFNALAASKFLPENYLIHIFCKADSRLLEEIKKYRVVYEGYVEEEELNKRLVNFDVGLSTQNPNLAFNQSSFPSKIVNYFACGLNVVSSRTISVLESPFNECVFYYDEDETGENIASAIMEAAKIINKELNQKLIEVMDTNSRKKISELFCYENTCN